MNANYPGYGYDYYTPRLSERINEATIDGEYSPEDIERMRAEREAAEEEESDE